MHDERVPCLCDCWWDTRIQCVHIESDCMHSLLLAGTLATRPLRQTERLSGRRDLQQIRPFCTLFWKKKTGVYVFSWLCLSLWLWYGFSLLILSLFSLWCGTILSFPRTLFYPTDQRDWRGSAALHYSEHNAIVATTTRHRAGRGIALLNLYLVHYWCSTTPLCALAVLPVCCLPLYWFSIWAHQRTAVFGSVWRRESSKNHGGKKLFSSGARI